MFLKKKNKASTAGRPAEAINVKIPNHDINLLVYYRGCYLCMERACQNGKQQPHVSYSKSWKVKEILKHWTLILDAGI